MISWQCGQYDREVNKLAPEINRYASIFKKEPQHKNNKVSIKGCVIITLLLLQYPVMFQYEPVFQIEHQI